MNLLLEFYLGHNFYFQGFFLLLNYFLEKMDFWDSVLCMSHFADKLRSITNAKWHLLFYLLQFILKTYLSSSAIGTPIRFVYSCRILKMLRPFVPHSTTSFLLAPYKLHLEELIELKLDYKTCLDFRFLITQ